MRIAYVSDFGDHGTFLNTFGTSVALLLASIESVDQVDVYCPVNRFNVTSESYSPKIKINEFYSYDQPLSILRLLSIKKGAYDKLIFNTLSTGFGTSGLANSLGLIIPIILSFLSKETKVEVIYHNSAFTNDAALLGYNSKIDKVKINILKFLEATLFRFVSTHILVQIYKRKIDMVVRPNRVSFMNPRFFDAIATTLITDYGRKTAINQTNGRLRSILMHGAWGPQKNLEYALNVLKTIKRDGFKFSLTISGKVNEHFHAYKSVFDSLLKQYAEVITEYRGYIPEDKIFDLFQKTDILVLPYSASGGYSGVLEQGIFFETYTIAIAFPEYKEQAEGINSVRLCKLTSLDEELRNALSIPAMVKNPNFFDKISEAKQNLMNDLGIK